MNNAGCVLEDDKMSTISGNEEAFDILDAWHKATNRRQITLVTAGRSGVGKSTLIGNMLNLKGDAAPRHRHGPSSTTTDVNLYTSIMGGIEVRIIDTPGLAATDVNELKSIAALQDMSGGKADMLLYCISILPNSKIDQRDQIIIKILSRVFGKNIWEHAVLVFTFANVVTMLAETEDIPELVKEYADKFQSVLQSICPSFSVISIFSCCQNQVKRPSSMIVALPAGLVPDKELVEGGYWDESIYMEALKKCDHDVIPAFLKVREPSPWMIRKAVAIGQYIGVSGITGGSGALVGAAVGGAIGGGAGLLAGGAGAGPGAVLGAKIGAAAVGGVCAVVKAKKVHSDVREYEEEQDYLDRVQEAVRQRRNN